MSEFLLGMLTGAAIVGGALVLGRWVAGASPGRDADLPPGSPGPAPPEPRSLP